MKIVKPRFYDDFGCIADKCTDNCCIGWEIDIDPAAMARFDKAEGAFGERLRSAIIRGEQPTFANTAGERCALLRGDGLCELVLNMGEGALCDICALHPRFFGCYNGIEEAGLGLCCEEVCRLLFSDSAPLSFIEEQSSEPSRENCGEELLRAVLSARERVFALLRDRSLPLGERLCKCTAFVRATQFSLDNGSPLPENVPETEKLTPDERRETAAALLKLLSDGEPLNAEWTARSSELLSRAEELFGALPRFFEENGGALWQYEHIAVYFVYRHFLTGALDGEIVSGMGLAAAAVLSVALLDCLTWLDGGALSDRDRICNVKLYSKQTEYSEEVEQQMRDAFWDIPELDPERIAGCIPE
ncbi:MAG: flagellin lysine-N-methylase [Oscillospiraceae bacterium]